MSRFETVVTSLGVAPMKIAERGFAPVVFVIRGALPRIDALEWLEPEGADLAFVHLPGMHTPRLDVLSIPAFAQAFDEIVRRNFAGRPVTVLGMSTGAIVAAAMDAPEIRARVLIEPFFTTAELWPFRMWLRREKPADLKPLWTWLWAILGIGPEAHEARDYSGLLRPGAPIFAVVGDRPLQPPRPLAELPSLAGEGDRALLRARGADLRVVPGGHNLEGACPDAIRLAVADALKA